MADSLIPWSRIYQFYISSERVNYRVCAEKYHVSEQSVKAHGAKEQWVLKKKEVFKAALALMENRTADLIAKRNSEHIRLAQSLLTSADHALKENPKTAPNSARDVKDFIDVGVKIERQALGMDIKTNPAVSVTDQKGQTVKITWGDGASLDDY